MLGVEPGLERVEPAGELAVQGFQLDVDGIEPGLERIEPAEELPVLGVEPGFERIELRFELRVHGHERGVDGPDGVVEVSLGDHAFGQLVAESACQSLGLLRFEA